MGVKPTLVIYTHTDMKDVWPMFFGQLKKYIGDEKIYVAVNEDDSYLSDYIRIIYDDSKAYTDRWVEILPHIKEELLLFMHEDMILFDSPKFDLIEKYSEYVNNKMVDSVKLIYAGEGGMEWPEDKTLIVNPYSKFSIQPTIFRKELLQQLVEGLPNKNIWEFEEAIISYGSDFMVRLGNEKKRGLYHYDSIVWPYIATAINKGKWNMSEYSKELDSLFREYNINPFERGIA
jgi:hypothetical protein